MLHSSLQLRPRTSCKPVSSCCPGPFYASSTAASLTCTIYALGNRSVAHFNFPRMPLRLLCSRSSHTGSCSVQSVNASWLRLRSSYVRSWMLIRICTHTQLLGSSSCLRLGGPTDYFQCSEGPCMSGDNSSSFDAMEKQYAAGTDERRSRSQLPAVIIPAVIIQVGMPRSPLRPC